MVSSLFAYTPMASANPTSGVIDTFADGSASLTVQTDSTAPTTVNLTLQRNSTIGGASFHITYDVNDPSPGSLTVDLDSDGQYEWHLGSTGDGRVGEQIVFSNGATSTTVSANGNQTWLPAGSWRLPTSAQMSSSEITVGFSPDLELNSVALVPLQICKLETWTAMELKIQSFWFKSIRRQMGPLRHTLDG